MLSILLSLFAALVNGPSGYDLEVLMADGVGVIRTELRKSPCTRLREYFRQAEAEVISNSRNKLHQTTCKDFFSALYMYYLQFVKERKAIRFMFLVHDFSALGAPNGTLDGAPSRWP